MVGTERMQDNYVVTLFWSRLVDMTPPEEVEYRERDIQLLREAERMPGFVGVKSYTADDGERLSVVVFDSDESQRQWASHPGHRVAQQEGRERFYAEYQIVIARTVRHHRWSETEAGDARHPAPVSNVVEHPGAR